MRMLFTMGKGDDLDQAVRIAAVDLDLHVSDVSNTGRVAQGELPAGCKPVVRRQSQPGRPG